MSNPLELIKAINADKEAISDARQDLATLASLEKSFPQHYAGDEARLLNAMITYHRSATQALISEASNRIKFYRQMLLTLEGSHGS